MPKPPPRPLNQVCHSVTSVKAMSVAPSGRGRDWEDAQAPIWAGRARVAETSTTPPGASGKVFGFVSAGLPLGVQFVAAQSRRVDEEPRTHALTASCGDGGDVVHDRVRAGGDGGHPVDRA